VLKGVEGLGVNLGKVPAEYAGTMGKLADSRILAAAQLAIEAQKATTGSGQPEDGNGYRESAKRLEECVEALIDAEPHDDRWDGVASQAYRDTNDEHRRIVSAVQVADQTIGQILSVEADQVSRTRKTLDETSQNLYDYGLATAWMNVIPGAAQAKMVADGIAAAGALATTDATLWILVKNSVENAMRVQKVINAYQGAAKDTSGNGGPCGTFVPPLKDQSDLPSRLNPHSEYSVPEPEEPPQFGPPAKPSGSPTHAPTTTPTAAP
jgi:hypothetical protein